ncbi:flagellar export chaperone FliS [Clostridium estertheticum]|uniref:flagellar export chaperone FliS n=1 Tax=Clostridium estertheticum TaxID=238834 RepID=UPI001C0AC34D|nr:flagellar export chaperone FliS [Clostridium estertheticum]MBU3186004.1 flagellar export chaperone FliS [Clostridium estertheticum]
MATNVYGNAFNTYKSNSVNFASKEQLLLMLVDGASKFSKIGRQAIIDKDVKKAHENIVKTQNIFYELMATLDVAKGGEWAESLMKVYDFITRRLVDANIKKSEKIMDEIIPLIDDIRDTWNEAYKKSKGGK